MYLQGSGLPLFLGSNLSHNLDPSRAYLAPLSPENNKDRNMHLITKIVVFLTLLAVELRAANIASNPAKATRWSAVPRSLRGINHGRIDDMDIEYPPLLRRKDLLTRQAGCSPTQVACEGNNCCPFGFTCYSTGSDVGCCPVGETCQGPLIGCADPNSFECPASIGGCCPNDQECYIDSPGVVGCRDTTVSSEAVPIYGFTLPTVTTSETVTGSADPIYASESTVGSADPIYESSRDNPTSAPSGSGSGTETGPRTTITGNSVEERMGLGLGVLLVPFVLALLG